MNVTNSEEIDQKRKGFSKIPKSRTRYGSEIQLHGSLQDNEML